MSAAGAAAYSALRAHLDSPRRRVVRVWNDRHPDWHRPPPAPDDAPGPPPRDRDTCAIICRFTAVFRIVCVQIAAEMVDEWFGQWRADTAQRGAQDARLDARADAIRLVRRWLHAPAAVGRDELAAAWTRTNGLAYEYTGADVIGSYCLRAAAAAVQHVYDFHPMHPGDPVGWAVNAAAAWHWYLNSLDASRRSGDSDADGNAFIEHWWRVCRCRLAFRDALTASFELATT
ncbi:MAG: hypothetical protein AB7S36_07135 [Planctomycetota bacterium]